MILARRTHPAEMAPLRPPALVAVDPRDERIAQLTAGLAEALAAAGPKGRAKASAPAG